MTVTNGAPNGTNGTMATANGHHGFDTIKDTIDAFSRGEFVICLDDTQRENEGDLMLAAEACTTEKMAFLIRHTSGYVCAPLAPERIAALGLPPMVAHSQDVLRTAYTVSVDARAPAAVFSTGISAHDRAYTARVLADPCATPASLRRPGHLLPLAARPGGVRQRRGHTEAGLELCRLAGMRPACVICELVLDGEEVEGRAERVGAGMMRRDDCLAFGRKYGIRVCTIEDLVVYVEEREGKLGKC